MTDEELIARLRSLKWLIHDEMRGLLQDGTAHDAAARIEALIAEREAVAAGWLCASCGRSYAPTVSGCRSCNQKVAESEKVDS